METKVNDEPPSVADDMNLFIPDSALGMQRCRHWTPLLTQQLRLRHLYQIMVYNVTSRSGAFVIRIWQTQENDVDVVIVTWVINLSGLVYLGVKLSEIQPDSFNENSVILHLRGGYFASYISLRTDLQKPLQFIDNLNVSSDEFKTKVFRCTSLKVIKNEMKPSYNVSKLQKLHLLQLNIKNQSLDVQKLRDNIISKCGLCNADEVKRSASCNEVPRRQHSSQLLTMTTLNKMLQWQEKPTIEQRQRIINVCKQIEIAKFRTRLLSQERDKQSAHLRQLKVNYSTLVDENEERGYLLMENYRILSRDSDKLKEWCSKQIQLKEIFLQTYAQLHHRRQQLMSQLLIMYPIEQVTPRKSLIGGIYLPDSDMLSDCSDGGLAVALGYTSHILLMCASFVQVPLRYNITFFGSRSYITDHINTALLDRDRDFPLYTKGKDKMQFNYAVYLLNKNIAQLRWLCGQHTPDLRATLPNLQSFLQGRGNKDHALAALPTNKTKTPNHVYKSVDFISQFEKPFLGSSSNISDPILDTLRQENQERTMSPINRRKKNDGPRPGLSEILAIPEAFLTQQISTNAFKTFATTEKFKLLSQEGRGDSDSKASSSKSASEASCSHPTSSNRNDVDNIEQGTDILHSSMNKTDVNSIDVNVKAVILEERPRKDHADKLLKQNRRISRSVGSITEEESFDLHSSLELGSDPLINVSAETNKSFNSRPLNSRLDDGQQEFLQKWLDSGPALVCSEENLYPDEILGSTIGISNSSSSPLTTRTDALLNTTSFNLIKPK